MVDPDAEDRPGSRRPAPGRRASPTRRGRGSRRSPRPRSRPRSRPARPRTGRVRSRNASDGTMIPKNIAIPPSRGIGIRWTRRSSGSSTAPKRRAIPATAGVSGTTIERRDNCAVDDLEVVPELMGDHVLGPVEPVALHRPELSPAPTPAKPAPALLGRLRRAYAGSPAPAPAKPAPALLGRLRRAYAGSPASASYFVPYSRSPASPRPGTMKPRSFRPRSSRGTDDVHVRVRRRGPSRSPRARRRGRRA